MVAGRKNEQAGLEFKGIDVVAVDPLELNHQFHAENCATASPIIKVLEVPSVRSRMFVL